MNEQASNPQTVSSEELSTELPPFVGPHTIQPGRHLFGREREIHDLVDLLISRRIVLLYSPSGAGKSSLINGGLIPALEDEFFTLYPVIHVDEEVKGSAAGRASAGTPNRYVFSALRSLESGRPDSQKLPESALISLSLPDYLDRREKELAEDAAVVLIFDQFEEILTINPVDQDKKREFFAQVGEALRDTRRWALFVMREDYIGSLDPEFLSLLPTQLSVRMRLDLLSFEAAQLAIRRPTPRVVRYEADCRFNTFKKEAAKALAKDLSQIRVQVADDWQVVDGPYVEPVHLQVVCKRLWENRPDKEVKTIDSDLVEKSESVDEALAGYYADNVGAISRQRSIPEWLIRDWFGSKLITAQRIRGQVMRGKEQSQGLNNKAVDQLVDAYLVRKEIRRGITWYELAHDRLVVPILQDNKRWQEDNLSDYYARAARWKSLEEPDELLLQEHQVAELERWELDNPGQLTFDEEALLDKSRRRLHRLLSERQADIERQADLDQLGWGIIFAEDAPAEVFAGLSDLRVLRQEQAAQRNSAYYKEFVYQPGETARQFLARQGVGTGSVDPEKVPHYLLIVGSPEAIPFEFQYELDLQYSVGRIYFEDPAAYVTYAQSVVAAEQGRVQLPRRAAFFAPARPNDVSDIKYQNLVQPIFERSGVDFKEWDRRAFFGQAATKEQLARLLSGEETPALLFAAGRGFRVAAGGERQLAEQGAFICADWPGRLMPSPDVYFAATDLTDEATPIGMIAFFASAYSVGVPATSDFGLLEPEIRPSADHAFVTRLPQRLLGHPNGGALAICGQVDRDLFTAHHPLERTVYYEVIRRLMAGHTVGSAMEVFDQRYAVFAARVSERLRQSLLPGQETESSASDRFELDQLLTAMIDARNFIIFGDPAVRLPLAAAAEDVLRPTIKAAEPERQPAQEARPAPELVAKRATISRGLGPESAYVDLEMDLRRQGDPADGDYILSMLTVLPGADTELFSGNVRVTIDLTELSQLSIDGPAYGRALAGMIFKDEARNAFYQARGAAEAVGVPLRLRLRIADDALELQALRWEWLGDVIDPNVSLLSRSNVLFSRYVTVPDWRRLEARTDFNALVVIANPADLADYGLEPLDVEAELARVREALGDIPTTFLINAPGAAGQSTLPNIIRYLSQRSYSLLYILAHGGYSKRLDEYVLFLSDENNAVDVVRAADFTQRLAELSQPPQLIVLGASGASAYESSPAWLAPGMIAAGVPAVLAMQGFISLTTVSTFMTTMFHELVSHGIVDRAVARARSAVYAERREDWWVPALFMRLKSGRIWSVASQKEEAGVAEPFFMAPALPANYVSAPEFLNPAVDALVGGQEGPQVIALTGAGGIGKTTTAIAACHEDAVRQRFGDGILWVNLGPDPDLRDRLDLLVGLVAGARLGSETLEEAASQWRQLTRGLSILLVVDDLWQADHLRPFLGLSPGGRILITTRNRAAVPAGARLIALDALSDQEAIKILGTGLSEQEQQQLLPLARKLGNWPLVLSLANGLLRQRLELGQALPDVIGYLDRAIERRGPEAFDQLGASNRSQSLARTLEVSLVALAAGEQERLTELAIFPEDVAIPLSIIALLWQATGKLDELEAEELCLRLHSQSLVEVDLQIKAVYLHDLIRDFLAGRAKDKLPGLQRQFLNAYWDAYDLQSWSQMPADESYLCYHLPHHLAGTGDERRLRDLLYDFAWLRARQEKSGIYSLLEDFEYLPELDSIDALLLEALRLAAPIVEADKTLFGGQLAGRLGRMELDEVDSLLDSVAQSQTTPWLRPLTGHLIPAARDAAGRAGPVNLVALAPDGSVALSASWDKTILAWDMVNGDRLMTLTGHQDRISALVVDKQGKFASSGSLDGQIRFWEEADFVSAGPGSESGSLHQSMVKIDGPVWALAMLPDDQRIVAASTNIWLLDLSLDKVPVLPLSGHLDWVHCLAVSPDRPLIASGSWDCTVRIWETLTGQALHVLRGHTGRISKVAFDSGGQWLLSAADDGSLIQWDLQSGRKMQALTGHAGPVTDFVITPDAGQVVSASEDATLKVWDVASGQLLRTLSGHSGPIRALALAGDGRVLVSAAEDGFVNVWNPAGGDRIAAYKSDGALWSCAMTADGQNIIAGDSLGWAHILRLESPSQESA